MVYYVLFNLIWKHVNPLITLYAPDRQLQIGHVLWGMVLARSTRYARKFARSNAPVENAELVTGQVLPPIYKQLASHQASGIFVLSVTSLSALKIRDALLGERKALIEARDRAGRMADANFHRPRPPVKRT